MSIVIYIFKNLVLLCVTWMGIRIIGKKSIAQMTAYELAAVMIMSTVAAQPIANKIASQDAVGILSIALGTSLLGWISLKRYFYNINGRPDIIVANGKIITHVLKSNKMNIQMLMSMLRLQGYARLSEVEFAIIEPNGNVSVIPKSQERPVKSKELKLQTPYEGLSLPLIIDGIILPQNLSYAMLDTQWLMDQLKAQGIEDISDILLAELDTEGGLYVSRRSDEPNTPGDI